MPTPADQSRRPRLRISVGAMMLLVLIVAILVGWRVNRASDQRRAVATIQRLGAAVQYDYQYAGGDPAGKEIPNARPPGPAWLRKMIGDEFFGEVVGLNIAGMGWTDPDLSVLEELPRLRSLMLHRTSKITNAGLIHLRTLRGLRHPDIYRNPAISDGGIASLENLTALEVLHLDGSSVTDAGLDHLRAMEQLVELDIDGTPVGNAGLARLKALPRLKKLYVQNSKATEEGAADLKRSLSGVEINLGSRPGSWGLALPATAASPPK